MGFFANIKKYFAERRERARLPIIDVKKRFDLMGRLGQGSMSKVWRARDHRSGRVMCLKVLDKVKTAKFEARFAAHLKRPMEGAILMALDHPNVVKAFEHGWTTEKQQYIVMELVEGMGLNFLIETNSKVIEEHRIDILAQLATAIEFTHKTGFLHRDICPRNVMVTNDRVVKLIDFGLAIPYTPAFCKPGNRTGTTNYLAPELIKRLPTDHRVDMFALGVTAYEAFTGDLPWERSDSLTVLGAHMNSPGRDPREIKPDLHPKIVAFLKKAVQREPRDRFQNPAEFKEALEKLPEG